MGGGGHGHGHGDPYKIPDYRIYKVEDVPRLMQVKKALAAQGLSDPWLRNEVWRYNPKEFGTNAELVKILMFRGFKLGLAATVVTVLGTAIYDRIFPDEHHHHGAGGDH